MSWDSPWPTKFFMSAAVVVLVAGRAATHKRQTPALSAAPQAAIAADGEMRDAVASPALPMAAGGWLAASGAAAVGRAARVPALLRPIQQTLPPRPTSGRAVFSGQRVIVETIKLGIPEPALAASR